MAAAVGKNLQRTVAGDNGAVEWFLMNKNAWHIQGVLGINISYTG